jgi:hypothetical protein
MNDKISTVNFTTKGGHTLQVFFNADTNLLVVDVVHKSEAGGNEVVRMKLNESKLLGHVDKSL